MAKSSTHLRYSILALSARQLERRQNQKSQSESLSLYQEAIHLLLPELGEKTTPVIASCVILCVLEMLSCKFSDFCGLICPILTMAGNPKEWRRHLDGCAYLIQAAGINGFSGKEEQALFWCFARMGTELFPIHFLLSLSSFLIQVRCLWRSHIRRRDYHSYSQLAAN